LGKDKKEHISRIALELFARKGFSVTTMRDISKEGKVNVALIYYYFKDKEEILYHIVQGSFRDLITILKEIQLREEDPFDCLKEMIVRQVVFTSESIKETKVIVMEMDNIHGQRKNDCKKLEREVYDIYMGQLRKLKELDYLGDVDPTVVIFAIFGMMNWFYRWYLKGKPLTPENVAHQMVTVLESGILKGEGKNRLISAATAAKTGAWDAGTRRHRKA